MGAFNILRGTAICPRCNKASTVEVQFKYGRVWQEEYELGEELRWGGNEVGDRTERHVVVDGVAQSACEHCGYDDEWNLYVFVKDGCVDRVQTADGTYDFVAALNTFISIPG